MTIKYKIPKVRFKEFCEEYKEYRLSELMGRYSQNNKDEEFSIDDILSLSSQYGIVNRKELLEDMYSKVNHKNYIKTRLNDFIYGKSISANYPYGLFKANNYKDGLLSTLYFTFKVVENVSPTYLDFYFSYPNRANNFLKKYVLVGDRYITADANYILSGKIFMPVKQEQQKIASFFTSIDQKISQLKRKKTLLEQYKKGVMRKIFSQEIRFKDDNGQEFPKWEKKRLGEVSVRNQNKNKTNRETKVLTNSAINGIVLQSDYFDKDIANQNNLLNYYIVEVDDFVYNPRISVNAPVGPIKRNHIGVGVMSPLYSVFRITVGVSDFFELYFSTTYWHKYLKGIANYGARYDRMNITTNDLYKMPIPFPSLPEQIKIANFISAIDNKIDNTNNQIEKAEVWKKGLMQQMFV